MSLIENRIESSAIKNKLSKALSDESVKSDYIRLQRLRSGNYIELDHFIRSDKSFSGFYGHVMVAVVARDLKETPTDDPQEQLKKKESKRIKNMILIFIKNGNIQQVKQLLEGYEQIMPFDTDIKGIKKS